MKIILNGCNGRMGKVLQTQIAATDGLTVVAGIDRMTDPASDFPQFTSLAACTEAADVVIDFSHYAGLPALLTDAVKKGLPTVVATTGLQKEQLAQLSETAKEIPIFFSANMSLGINVLIKALQTVSGALEDSFNIEIIEKHHNQKKDAPSGTALLLADSINDVLLAKKDYVFGRHGSDLENPLQELGIHAVRGGTIPGEHTVLFAGLDEVIEFKHTALSRDIFANGAIKAAQYLVQQPAGLYSMADLLA